MQWIFLGHWTLLKESFQMASGSLLAWQARLVDAAHAPRREVGSTRSHRRSPSPLNTAMMAQKSTEAW